MELVTDPATFRAPAGTAVTIGAYDGLHRGHQYVIGRLRGMAAAAGLDSVVLTFDRHPAAVVRPDSAPLLLTDLEQKVELLASTGIDHTVVLHFDEARSQEEPEDFVRDVLVSALRARIVVVGEDFHFGRRRRGNVALLADMGASLGFEVVHLPLMPVADGAPPMSSTAIRRLLETGDVAGAAAQLGRPHQVRGPVEQGDQRGRELGYPTANVAVPADILLPAAGVYAGWYVHPDGSHHAAAISVGRRPMFHGAGSPVVLEAYLLDFSGDLYGQRGAVAFVRHLRDEERFESVDALVEQMGRDVDATRSVVSPQPTVS
ncbi:MAG: bifunctional riboflavin kinase/FAD synthetase [Actinomycetota bacterium]|nr:bifunctional riboflavin kinase/FAD synthetase [Actinomycetota bacterium]